MRESFVPLQGATVERDGLHVGTTKDVVKEAPHMEADGHLTDAEGMQLYRHYGMTMRGAGGDGRREQAGERRSTMTADRPTTPDQRRPERAEQTDQNTMIRSEEQLRVGTEQVETGRVRLHKYVVTEEQQVSVPVRHEEVRIEREPVQVGDRAAMAGRSQIGEADQEVILHEERPVVRTETVPVEKVRLGTETVVEQQNVTGKVRKEQIEVDDRSGKRGSAK